MNQDYIGLYDMAKEVVINVATGIGAASGLATAITQAIQMVQRVF